MKHHILYFWDAQDPEKNEIVLRQARKLVGPKAPGAHRAHGPRPLGPMAQYTAMQSRGSGTGPGQATAWLRMGPMGPRGLGPWALWAPGALGPN